MNGTLQELGLKYGTDKATYHKFCDFYDKNLSELRDDKIRFLEIGIANGNSIKMWNEYFLNAEIIGVDILDRKYLDTARVKTYIVNQENENELLSIPGEFEIIVDDGGHTMLQQQITLKVMIDKLKSGGFYILEDLHTSQLHFQKHGFGCTEINNTHRLLEDLKNEEMTGEYHINADDFNVIESKIKSIEIFVTEAGSVTSIIRKK